MTQADRSRIRNREIAEDRRARQVIEGRPRNRPYWLDTALTLLGLSPLIGAIVASVLHEAWK